VFLLFLLFYLLELARPRLRGLPLPIYRQPIFHVASIIFIVFLVLNIVTSIATSETISESLGFLSILLTMALVSFYAQTEGRVKLVVNILMVTGLFAAIHGLTQYFYDRAASPLDSFFAWHNPAGGYFASILILFLTLLFTNSPTKILGRYGWIGSIILSAALLFTLSRGAWLSFILAFAVLILLLGIKGVFNKTGSLVFLGVIILAIILIVAVGGKSVLEPVYQRFVSFSAMKDFSVEGRRNFYSGAVEIFKNAPYTGIGLGSFGFVYPRYQSDPRFYAKDPHSFYLRLISEGGMLGLLIVLLIFYCFFYVVRLYFRNRNKAIAPVACGLIASLVAELSHLAIDFDDTFLLILLNLGLIWICALNLLSPLNTDIEQNNLESDTEPAKKKSFPWRNVLLILFFFLIIFHSGRMYLSESNYDIAKAYSNASMWAEAEKSSRLALDYYPGNDRALFERSRALIFLFDAKMQPNDGKDVDDELLLEKAVVSIAKLKRLAPYKASTYYLSGLAQLRLKNIRPDILLSDFDKALEFDPMNSPEFYLDTARAHGYFGDVENFKEIIAKFKKTYPFDRVEEYVRTRLEWDKLPLIYEDVLRLENDGLEYEGRYVELLDNVAKMLELEKVRERILGDAYEPRKELIDYTSLAKERYGEKTSEDEDVKSVIDEMSGF